METVRGRRGQHAHFRGRHRRPTRHWARMLPRLPGALAIAAYLMIAASLIH